LSSLEWIGERVHGSVTYMVSRDTKVMSFIYEP
jgi:hypothetical protein